MGTSEGEGRTGLITGASSRIGESLAHCFAASGHGLVLVARSKDKLAASAKTLKAAHDVKVTVLPADVASAGAARCRRSLRHCSTSASRSMRLSKTPVCWSGAFSLRCRRSGTGSLWT